MWVNQEVIFVVVGAHPVRDEIQRACFTDFSKARIPIWQQVIVNEAIAHQITNFLPGLDIAELARVEVQLALRDFSKSAFYLALSI